MQTWKFKQTGDKPTNRETVFFDETGKKVEDVISFTAHAGRLEKQYFEVTIRVYLEELE